MSTLEEVGKPTRLAAESPLPLNVGAAEFGAADPDVFEVRLNHAISVTESEVASGSGESLLEVGSGPHGWGPFPLTASQLEAVLTRLRAAADAWDVPAEVTVLRTRGGTIVDEASRSVDSQICDVLARRKAHNLPIEVRIAFIGNVDSGKSTMVGVLTRSILDDGRGGARSKVFKHEHETSTGRTSSIGQHTLCLSSSGDILNDATFRTTNCADFVSKSAKVVTLVDLAGHEKYFKTTAFGLTGHMPDYAALIVGANAGVVGMCKEHLGVALALKVPVFFVVTKIDSTPAHITQESIANLSAILKKPGVRKKPFVVRSRSDALTCVRNIHSQHLAPIFLSSSVTGEGLDLLRLFINLLASRSCWAEAASGKSLFLIDETFAVAGVGTVVAGTLKTGAIGPNTTLLLGPDLADGGFHPATIRSVHYKRLPVQSVVAGQTAALSLKKVKRNAVRKGMVLIDPSLKPQSSWEFDADIAILTHSTTIQPRYQAVIHCEAVRQAARVVAMSSERLRTGDRAVVRWRFLQRPEYVTPGTRFVFREGRTKGIGMVMHHQEAVAPQVVEEA